MQLESAQPKLLYVGRSFVSPSFDLFVIGGLLTLPIAVWSFFAGSNTVNFLSGNLPLVILLANQAHFAASTVRLYSKPRALEEMSFATKVLPILTLGVVTICVAFAGTLGYHLQALYFSWSPYHYAAQTFGLAVMYCYRSGCELDAGTRRLVRIVCLLPFAKALVAAWPLGFGMGWLIPYSFLTENPDLLALVYRANLGLSVLTLASPLALFAWIGIRARTRRDGGEGMPLLSLVLILANAVWWTLFSYWDAVVWSTILHSIQYLGIVTIFHARDQVARPDNSHSPIWHVVTFYLASAALGYGLFQCWPQAYVWAGFGQVESVFMVIAVINIHHFIVDRFIWRIRKDQNYKTVMDA